MRLSTWRLVALRHLVVWLVALVVPLQGLAVSLLQVRGPEHTHVRAQDDALLAADFRRNLGRRVNTGSVGQLFGDAIHGHAHSEASAHHHLIDDASVRYVDGDGFGGALGEEASSSAGGGTGMFLPLPVFVLNWFDPLVGAVPAWGLLWTPTATFQVRLDRPPGRPAA